MMNKLVLLVLICPSLQFDEISDIERVNGAQGSLRLYPAYNSLGLDESDSAKFKGKIIPAVFNWYSLLLNVNSVKDNLRLGGLNDCNACEVSEDHKVSGVEADVIVYFVSGSSTKASACAVDSETNAPVVGCVELKASDWSDISLELGFTLLAKLLGHILVYDTDLLEQFATLESNTIAAPKLLDLVSEHFGEEVSSFPFKESKDEWYDTVMNEDFMEESTVHGYIQVMSSISCALFEDSGWYSVNWEYSSPSLWGKGGGQDFIDASCPTPCEFTENTCHYSRLAYDLCRHPGCPKVYAREYATYCFKEESASSNRGETFGTSSKCFESTLSDSEADSDDLSTSPGCYEYSCRGATLYIIVDGQEKACSGEGDSLSFSGYSGAITCGSFDEICSENMCLFACFGNGECEDGKCECDSGYSGLYCETYTCHSSCSDCNGPNSDQCLSCDSGSLEKIEGFEHGSCSSTGTEEVSTCPRLCEECDDDGTCVDCVRHSEYNQETNDCECKDDYLPDLISGECVETNTWECFNNCETCNDEDPYYCLSCRKGYGLLRLPGRSHCVD